VCVQPRERTNETIMHEIVSILRVSRQYGCVTTEGRYALFNLGDFTRR
jgi:hypothetical protein